MSDDERAVDGLIGDLVNEFRGITRVHAARLYAKIQRRIDDAPPIRARLRVGRRGVPQTNTEHGDGAGNSKACTVHQCSSQWTASKSRASWIGRNWPLDGTSARTGRPRCPEWGSRYPTIRRGRRVDSAGANLSRR